MKPKPLKNKIIKGEDFGFKDLIEVKDIKSAVEWLKENLQENVNKTGALMLINEAFEDVVKKN